MKELDPTSLATDLLDEGIAQGVKSPILEPVGANTAFSNAAWDGNIPIETSPRVKAVSVYVKRPSPFLKKAHLPSQKMSWS